MCFGKRPLSKPPRAAAAAAEHGRYLLRHGKVEERVAEVEERVKRVVASIQQATFTGKGDKELVPNLYTSYIERVATALMSTLSLKATVGDAVEAMPMPSRYLLDTYLKYLGWQLNDVGSATVRAISLQGLVRAAPRSARRARPRSSRCHRARARARRRPPRRGERRPPRPLRPRVSAR